MKKILSAVIVSSLLLTVSAMVSFRPVLGYQVGMYEDHKKSTQNETSCEKCKQVNLGVGQRWAICDDTMNPKDELCDVQADGINCEVFEGDCSGRAIA